MPEGRTNDRCVEMPAAAPARVTSMANPIETTAVPTNFCAFVSPSDRRRDTFM